MTISEVTAPAAEPLGVEAAKVHLRITEVDDDAYLVSLIKAARRFAENYTGSVFVKRTLKLTLDDFPASSATPIIFPTGPVPAISSISYTDPDGVSQVWDSANYVLDTNPKRPRLLPAYGVDWPDTRDEINAVSITFTAGYEPVASPVDEIALQEVLPDDFVHAIKMIIGHWFENRMEVVIGTTAQQVPMAAMSLLWPYKIKAF